MDNKQIVTAFFEEGYTNKNFHFVMNCVDENYIDHSPCGAKGNSSVVEILKIVFEQFGNLKAEVKQVFAEGDMVSARVLFSGAHIGVAMGVQPTGKMISFEALENFKVKNGKIVESWGYWPDKQIEEMLRS